MPTSDIVYHLARSERGISTEIYFPRKAAYQGAIFDALRLGYKEGIVKQYLEKNAKALLGELGGDYPRLFNPHRYGESPLNKSEKLSPGMAKKRIGMYKSPFQGWSMYTVDGVFFGEDDKVFEETTQVVRLMFRFRSSFQAEAEAAHAKDVPRAILFWVMARRGRLNEHVAWNADEEERFLEELTPWPVGKLAFAKTYFIPIVKEVQKWIDDCALFLFGYLVRSFSAQVLAEGMYEEEIWIASFFHFTLNVVRRQEK